MIDEEPGPTIAETIAQFKAMVDAIKPIKPKTCNPVRGSRYQKLGLENFQQFRPRRSAAKWLEGAPEYVVACYDNRGRRSANRYTVLFGGSLWDVEAARANWAGGRDPRLMLCLIMSEGPTSTQGISMWSDCIRSSHLGLKVRWLDLPEHIRQHVIFRAGKT